MGIKCGQVHHLLSSMVHKIKYKSSQLCSELGLIHSYPAKDKIVVLSGLEYWLHYDLTASWQILTKTLWPLRRFVYVMGGSNYHVGCMDGNICSLQSPLVGIMPYQMLTSAVSKCVTAWSCWKAYFRNIYTSLNSYRHVGILTGRFGYPLQ